MEGELSASDYRTILRKRFPVVLFVFVVCVISAVVATHFMTPAYSAEAMVKYEPPMGRGPEEMMAMMSPQVQTEVNLLESIDMAMRVAKKMGAPTQGLNLDGYKRGYHSEQLGMSSLIRVTAKSTSPQKAADIANAVVDSGVEWDLELRSQGMRKKYAEVQDRKKHVAENLTVLEEKRKAFLESHQMSSLAPALASKLMDLEGQRKDLLKRYTAEHPEVRKLEQRIAVTAQQLSAMPAEQEELLRIDRDLKVQEETYVALAREEEQDRIALDSTFSYLTVVSRATPPIFPYYPKPSLNYLAGVVFGLFLGFYAALLLESMDISITTIEDIEKILQAPVLGIIPHFGSESRWEDFRTTYLRKDRHSEDKFRSFLAFRQSEHSPLIEGYHGLRVNIQSQLAKPGGMVLTFTSTGVAEGKTLTAVNFALAAAHSGLKTLLIGADIRRPVIHKIFGLPKENGLIEALTGKAPWQEVVHNTVDILMGEKDLEKLTSYPGIDNFKIMTGWTHNTAEVVNIFSSQALPALIAQLRSSFDIVVFDCPPVLLFVDAILIGQHTDGVVLVYKSGKMARRALKRARDQVVFSKGRILGVVLNDARATDMEPGYGYYDYGHYSKPKGETV